MLVDVQWTSSVIGDMIAVANGNLAGVHRLQQGIYEIGHFSFDQMIQAENEWPELGDEFNAFGVCDDPQQVLDQCPQLQDAGRKFVVSVTPVSKANQSADGGWRWHKWGPYIGTKTPTCEYLHDEPIIDKVYCYHIYEVG